jgi:hypothetical protein
MFPIVIYTEQPSEYDIYPDIQNNDTASYGKPGLEKVETASNSKPGLEKVETGSNGKPGLEKVETPVSYHNVKTVYVEEFSSGSVHLCSNSVVAWTLIVAIATTFLVIWC